LDYAAVHGHLDVVKVLLLYGATINQDVIKMCADRHPEVARLLRVVTRMHRGGRGNEYLVG
jgi:ankyrin repeat protein